MSQDLLQVFRTTCLFGGGYQKLRGGVREGGSLAEGGWSLPGHAICPRYASSVSTPQSTPSVPFVLDSGLPASTPEPTRKLLYRMFIRQSVHPSMDTFDHLPFAGTTGQPRVAAAKNSSPMFRVWLHLLSCSFSYSNLCALVPLLLGSAAPIRSSPGRSEPIRTLIGWGGSRG